MKTTILLVFVFLLLGCGSSYDVVHDGSAYNVKGSKIYKGGVEVTETVSDETKMHITNKLNERLVQEAEAKKMQKELRAQQNEQEQLQKEAEEKQKVLEAEQDRIEKVQKEKNDARKAFLHANDKLKKEQKKYSKLLDKEKLSSDDIEQWKNKLEQLKSEKDKAEAYYKSL